MDNENANAAAGSAGEVAGTTSSPCSANSGAATDAPATTSASIRDAELTHVNAQGRARMVDVGAKPVTSRVARAAARVLMAPSTLELVRTGGTRKGDVLAVAQLNSCKKFHRCKCHI